MPGRITGWVSFKSAANRAVQGIAECERALALDPNLARAHGLMGIGKIFSGRPDETEPHVKEALRLSPRRRLRLSLDVDRRCRQTAPSRRRGGRRVVGTLDRERPKLAARPFLSRRRLSKSRQAKRGARRRPRPGLLSIRHSQSVASASGPRPTIRVSCRRASTSMSACARQESPNNDRDPPPRRDPRRSWATRGSWVRMRRAASAAVPITLT